MTETTIEVVTIGRVDDLPLVLAQLERMEVATVLDQPFPTHGNWAGELSFGPVAVAGLSFILSHAGHRLNQVQSWAAQHQQTLSACLGTSVRALDFSDDRLADRLSRLGESERWSPVEDPVNQHLLRVCPLRSSWVRIDTATAETDAGASADGLFQYGQSKSQRADLAPVKTALSTVDPLGLPLVTTVVSGQRADDPHNQPQIKRVQQSLGPSGHVTVGEAKMAAVLTRAAIASRGDDYLCPLRGAQLQALPWEQVLEPGLKGRQALTEVRAADGPEVVAVGFETTGQLQAEVDGRPIGWTDRRLVVRSLTHAEAEAEKLERQLARAEAALQRLNGRKRGKPRLSAAELRAAAQRILEPHEVVGLVRLRVVRPRARARQRAGRKRLARLQWWRGRTFRERAKEQLGWRLYAANLPSREWDLERVVLAYRGQYLIEHGSSRLKGRPLGLLPLYLQDEQRVGGLIHLLSLGRRLLCVVEWVVANALARGQAEEDRVIRGVYAGQAGRATARPSTELLLRAFHGLTLLVYEVGGHLQTWLHPLGPVPQRILHLLGFSPDLYHRLVVHCLNPVPI